MKNKRKSRCCLHCKEGRFGLTNTDLTGLCALVHDGQYVAELSVSKAREFVAKVDSDAMVAFLTQQDQDYYTLCKARIGTVKARVSRTDVCDLYNG